MSWLARAYLGQHKEYTDPVRAPKTKMYEAAEAMFMYKISKPKPLVTTVGLLIIVVIVSRHCSRHSNTR